MLYVPKRLRPNHMLVRILGWQHAERLVQAFGGEVLQPANCEAIYQGFRDREIRRMKAEGIAGNAELAWIMGVTERHIRALVQEKSHVENDSANVNAARD